MGDEFFDFSSGDASFYDDIPDGGGREPSFSGGVFDAGDGPKNGCGKKIKLRPGYGRNCLLRHMTGVHHHKEPWKCRLCGHRTGLEQYMVYHHRSKHIDLPYEKPENCETLEDVQTMLDLWEACFPEMPPLRIAKLQEF